MNAASLSRRDLLRRLAAMAVVAPAAARAVPRVTIEQLEACEAFTGMRFTARERQQMLATVDEHLERLRLLQATGFENELPPAEIFDPRLPGWQTPTAQAPAGLLPAVPRAASGADLAYAPASHQLAWLRTGTVTSTALTELYLDRIAALDERFGAFVTVTRDLALEQAAAADRATRAGRLLGPLHGLPYGLKDLIDTAGITTTWGAVPYHGRVPAADAVIVRRLREAGAVLLGKTAPGALAYGDIWFRARTRNPWNLDEGSSGSSGGSAAAVAAGLCSFAIGSETMGSIVSPANRCGTVGLRATFGRVARTGTMSLCWSLDKLGVLARSAADVLPVLAAINGADVGDPASVDVVLPPEPAIDPSEVRLGWQAEWFAQGTETDRAFLEAVRRAGFRLVNVSLPEVDIQALGSLVVIEAAAAFERLTLDGTDDQLAWQEDAAWPNSWRAAHYHPAIAYVQAQRLRRRLMRQFADTLSGVDALIHPNFAACLLTIGNFTGHPCLTLPAGRLPQPTRSGFASHLPPSGEPGEVLHLVPFTASLTGRLHDEARLVAIGRRVEAELPSIGRPV